MRTAGAVLNCPKLLHSAARLLPYIVFEQPACILAVHTKILNKRHFLVVFLTFEFEKQTDEMYFLTYFEKRNWVIASEVA